MASHYLKDFNLALRYSLTYEKKGLVTIILRQLLTLNKQANKPTHTNPKTDEKQSNTSEMPVLRTEAWFVHKVKLPLY